MKRLIIIPSNTSLEISDKLINCSKALTFKFGRGNTLNVPLDKVTINSNDINVDVNIIVAVIKNADLACNNQIRSAANYLDENEKFLIDILCVSKYFSFTLFTKLVKNKLLAIFSKSDSEIKTIFASADSFDDISTKSLSDSVFYWSDSDNM